MYMVVNKTDNYDIIKDKIKTKAEAIQFIKNLKMFDKRQGNIFNDNYIIVKEE